MNDIYDVWEQCRRWDGDYNAAVERERTFSTRARSTRLSRENREGTGLREQSRPPADTLPKREPT